ncbi:unnamed protein product [Ascophyllum nodosum]
MAAGGDGAELRLADHFPLVHKTCKGPAGKFFDCFSEKGDQPPEGDASAAKKGLAACASLMTEYDRCMAKVPAKKLVRVQEEYRVSTAKKQ